MFARMLVAVDGSDIAGRALEFAIERAKIHGSHVTVAFAVNRIAVSAATANPYAYVDPLPLLQALDAEADAVLAAAEERVREAGLVSHREKLDGLPGQALLAYARRAKCDVIVMGTHGRTGLGRVAIGSTAEDVVRGAWVPVFTVSQRCAEVKPGPLTHLLVAVEGSPASEDALTLACKLASDERTKLTLCTVAEPAGFDWDDVDRDFFLEAEVEQRAKPLLERSRAHVTESGARADADLRQGPAVEEIVAAASDCGADCIVMGTHGRAGIPRFVLGSVAEGVLRSSKIPVCTIRHTHGTGSS